MELKCKSSHSRTLSSSYCTEAMKEKFLELQIVPANHSLLLLWPHVFILFKKKKKGGMGNHNHKVLRFLDLSGSELLQCCVDNHNLKLAFFLVHNDESHKIQGSYGGLNGRTKDRMR